MGYNLLIWGTSCLPYVKEQIEDLRAKGHRVTCESEKHDGPVGEVFANLLREADALICGPLPVKAEMVEKAPRLKVMSICASGYEIVDIGMLTRAGVAAANVRDGGMTRPVAELTLGLMLDSARSLSRVIRQMKAGIAERKAGTLLYGSTLGIVGLGAIGREVAIRAHAFGMKLLCHDPVTDAEFCARYAIRCVPLEQLLTQADFVTLHLRLNEKTRRMFGARELALMKESAFLINTARRELVDQDALFAALRSGRIAGASVDEEVEDRLLALDNVLSLPHIGNMCLASLREVFSTAVDNALAVLEGRTPGFLLNPEVLSGRKQEA